MNFEIQFYHRISYLGPLVAGILTGSFIIEKIFGIPGLGRVVESVTNESIPLLWVLLYFLAYS